MRYLLLVILIVTPSKFIFGQADRDGNDKPDIIGQKSLSTNEDQDLILELSDVYVIDWDDFYPSGFTMNVYPGNHYTFSGTTIIPEVNYSGMLKVPVTVNDGKEDSKKYDLNIEVKAVNDAPTITGQSSLSTNQNQSITIQLSNLMVTDPDDVFPNGFTMILYEGSNYTVSNNLITPIQDYYGMLSVPVTVNDGNVNSALYNLQIKVVKPNIAPVITGQVSLATSVDQTIAIKLSDVIVTDPDNSYPNDFTLKILPGSNYSSIGNTIVPADGFVGTLHVSITINDGMVDSAPFDLKIEVKPINVIPQIISQESLRINEDESIALLLSHLKVTDSDNTYPNGFTLSISAGTDYTILEGNVVKPNPNFNGNLVVSIKVSDGANISDPYSLLIIVNPINDAPTITTIETNALNYELERGSVNVTEEFVAIDVDDDSLSVGEVKFTSESFQLGKDQLLFSNTTNIRGVFDSNAGILSLIGKAPVEEYNQAIRSIQYNYNGSDSSIISHKTLLFSLNDGKNVSPAQQRLINLGDSFVDLDIPNGFTPNGDFVNDTWSVKPSKNIDARATPLIRVYSKRGVLVYETVGFDEEWDGKFNGEILPPDTYYYTIDLNLSSSKKTKYNGLVTILR
jgi:gliding motility-associated-like protein